jgi:hypothetical protein
LCTEGATQMSTSVRHATETHGVQAVAGSGAAPYTDGRERLREAPLRLTLRICLRARRERPRQAVGPFDAFGTTPQEAFYVKCDTQPHPFLCPARIGTAPLRSTSCTCGPERRTRLGCSSNGPHACPVNGPSRRMACCTRRCCTAVDAESCKARAEHVIRTTVAVSQPKRAVISTDVMALPLMRYTEGARVANVSAPIDKVPPWLS